LMSRTLRLASSARLLYWLSDHKVATKLVGGCSSLGPIWDRTLCTRPTTRTSTHPVPDRHSPTDQSKPLNTLPVGQCRQSGYGRSQWRPDSTHLNAWLGGVSAALCTAPCMTCRIETFLNRGSARGASRQRHADQ
jgi:hypothetical protein